MLIGTFNQEGLLRDWNLREPSSEALVTTLIFSFSIPSQTIVTGVTAHSADSHSSHTIIHWSSQQSHTVLSSYTHTASIYAAPWPLARSGIKSNIESGSPLEYPDTILRWRIRLLQCWHQYSSPFMHELLLRWTWMMSKLEISRVWGWDLGWRCRVPWSPKLHIFIFPAVWLWWVLTDDGRLSCSRGKNMWGGGDRVGPRDPHRNSLRHERQGFATNKKGSSNGDERYSST